MSSYLFGNPKKSIGMINDCPVAMKTENGKTIVEINGEEIVFGSRQAALSHLRNIAEPKGKGKKK